MAVYASSKKLIIEVYTDIFEDFQPMLRMKYILPVLGSSSRVNVVDVSCRPIGVVLILEFDCWTTLFE